MMILEQQDRPVVARAEPQVDPVCGLQDPVTNVAIRVKPLPARLGELHEDERLAKFGVGIEEPLDGQELLFDALGVVETIDADRKPDTERQVEFPSDLPSADLDLRGSSCVPLSS